MPDRTQDLKNHRQVTVACKNYTDTEIKKSEERILSIVARNNVDFIDHTNEPTYRFTAPANSKLLMLQSIAGNSNKIAPSTPSDDSVAKLKTIPENTYKSQIDYIGGKTVKYNQLLNKNNFLATTTINGVTFTNNGDGSITLNGTATAQISQNVCWTSGYQAGHKYFLKGCPSGGGGSTYTLFIVGQGATETGNGLIFERSSGANLQIGIASGYTCNNLRYTPEIVDLTLNYGAGNEPTSVDTAIPLLKSNGYKLDGTDEYSTGSLKHAVVSEVKYNPINEFNPSGLPTSLNSGGTKLGNNFTLKAGTYAVKVEFVSGVVPNTVQLKYANGTGIFDEAVSNRVMTTTFTLSSDSELYFGCWNSSSAGATSIQIMLNLGSTALPYIPYVAPITKAIPSEVLALDGYGMGINDSLYNYIDLNAKKYYKKVSKILGSSIVNIHKNVESTEDWLYYFSMAGGNGATENNQVICNKIETKNSAPIGTTTGCSITSSFGGIIYVNLYGLIQTNDLENAIAYIRANLEFIYPLPSVIEIDISQYLTTDFKVELNNQYATCEMVVDESIDMPNKVEYYGTIIHSLATAVKQDGFNVWDEEYKLGLIQYNKNQSNFGQEIAGNNIISKNYIEVNPNLTYYGKLGNVSANLIVFAYDSDKNPIIVGEYGYIAVNNQAFALPNNCRYIRFYATATYGTTYNHDICFNISNQDLNGTYKPYKAPITRLLPKSEAKYSWGITDGVRNTRVFCDDECNPVNEGQVDVGTYTFNGNESWFFNTESNREIITTSSTNLGKVGTTNGISDDNLGLQFVTNNYGSDGIYIATANVLTIFFRKYGVITDTASAKHYLVDRTVEYEKATTDTETLDDFDFSFDCEEGDTFTIIGCELLQCYATYSFLIKEAKSNE